MASAYADSMQAGPCFSASIQGRAKDPGGVTYYEILVSRNGGEEAWTMHRRYREFEFMSNTLRVQGINLPSMPRKSIVTKVFSTAFNDDRQRQLDQLLQAALGADPHLQHLAALRNFLIPPIRAPGPPAGHGAVTAGLPVYAGGGGGAPVAPRPAAAAPIPVVAGRVQQAEPSNSPRPSQAPAPPAWGAPQPPPVAYGQPVYAQQPVYTAQPPMYAAQPTYPPYSQAMYEDSCHYPHYHHRPHHQQGVSTGAAVGAGLTGLFAGAVGGMALEEALHQRRHRDQVIIERPGFGGFGGFGGPGIFGTEEVIREERRDIFGDTEVRTEVIDRDMFGNVTQVREDIVDRDIFGDVRETTTIQDGW